MAQKKPAASDLQGVNPADPLTERLISDVETLKALSDPLRIQILEIMVRQSDETWTVKRIAKALGVMPTKLYHHIKILEERDLIRPASQQLVRGIVETTYRIAQLSLRLDRELIAGGGDELRSSAAEAIMSVFDLARRDLEAAFAAGLLPTDPATDSGQSTLLNRSLYLLTPDRASQFRDRLVALCAEFASNQDSDASVPLGLLIALHPVPRPKAAPRTR